MLQNHLKTPEIGNFQEEDPVGRNKFFGNSFFPFFSVSQI
jgi:hypothetical protein